MLILKIVIKNVFVCDTTWLVENREEKHRQNCSWVINVSLPGIVNTHVTASLRAERD